jgi:small basic protein (TIGR04137 family)
MSLHKSLKRKDNLTRRRNVLSREERVERLQEQEKWDEDQSVFGLPKVKPQVVEAPTARKAKANEGEEEGEAGAESNEAQP